MPISDVMARIGEIQQRFGVQSTQFRLGPSPADMSPIASVDELPFVPRDVGGPAAAGIAEQLSLMRADLGLSPTQVLEMSDPVPAGGRLSSDYGLRSDPFTSETRMHRGVDVAAPMGTPIHAVAGGTVTFAGEMGSYGEIVIIDHGNGIESRSAHQAWVDVVVGQQVAAGDVIGAVGSTGRSTGPHLHFEIRVDGEAVDPEPWFSTFAGHDVGHDHG